MKTIYSNGARSAPIINTKRESHLEHLLTLALPYIQREELSTQTSQFTRHLIAEITGQLKKGSE